MPLHVCVCKCAHSMKTPVMLGVGSTLIQHDCISRDSSVLIVIPNEVPSYHTGRSGIQHIDPGEENIYQFVKPALSNKNLQNVGKQGVKIVPHKGLLFLAALRNLPHDPVNKLRLLCWIMRDTGSTASMTSCRSATLHNPEPGLSGSWPRWDCSKN